MLSALSHLFRLARAGYVFAREGVLALADPDLLPAPARLGLRIARLIERRDAGSNATRLAAALTRLGPTYVKLGQFLATRADVVGPAIARDLSALQDKMAPFPQAEALAAIAEGLGKPVDELFAEIGEPIAAASIAQVHKARLADGSFVAVKVARPGIARRFAADLDGFRFVATLLDRHVPAARRLRPLDVVGTLTRSMTMEMDFRMEAAALSEMAENAKDDGDFRVPTVDWERTARGILTTEWIDGTPLNNVAAVKAAGHNTPMLARTVMQSFLRHAVRDGFFHADMHPGNLFVDEAGRLVAVDFGITGRLGMKERRVLAEILYGFITRNYRRVAEVHMEVGYVPAHHSVEDFAQALRAIGEPIHSRAASDISMAKLLTLLFEVTALFDMETRPELILLQKTMVVVEGVARTLDGDFDMWSTSEPVLRQWIERNLGPVGRIEGAAQGALSLGKSMGEVPGLINRASLLSQRMDALTRNGLVLSPETLAGIGAAEARRARIGNLALWAIALAVIAFVVHHW